MGSYAWVTLATNDSYSLGALVLAHSLKQVGTSQQLVVLVTPGVTSPMRDKLSSVFNIVQEVNILDSKDETNLRLLKRPELGVTFTKLHCWRLTQFDKCVFLDADTLVLQNCDELFQREELSAAPDVGWPDCFNSGVFVFRPSNETYENLVQFALDKGSFDGGDQGLLNLYFSDWATQDISKHLPFIYNMCSTACYSYLPAFKQFGADAKIIHFIGSSKPWLQYFNTETQLVQPNTEVKHLQGVLQHWWNIFCSLIHPNLTQDMARSTSDVNMHTNRSYHQPPLPPSYYTPSSPSPSFPVWDPWDEYDKRQEVEESPNIHNSPEIIPNQVEQKPNPVPAPFIAPKPPISLSSSSSSYSELKPVESHNTNACFASCQEVSVPQHNETPPPPAPSCDDNVHSYNVISHHYHHSHHQHTEPENFHQPAAQRLENVDCSPQTVNLSSLPENLEPEIIPPVLPSESEAPAPVCSETTLHSSLPENSTNKGDDADGGLAGAFAQLTLGAARTAEQVALDDHLRRQGWEVGNIDYLGRDSFENIWSKICETLSGGPSPVAVQPKEPTPPPSTEEAAKTPPVVAEKPVDTSSAVKEIIPTPAEQPQSPPAQAPQPPTPEVVAVVTQPEPVPQRVPETPQPTPVTPQVPESPQPTPAAPEVPQPISAAPQATPATPEVLQSSQPTPPAAVVPQSPQPTPATAAVPQSPQPTPAAAVVPESPQPTPAVAAVPQSPQSTPAAAAVAQSPQTTSAVAVIPQSPQPTSAVAVVPQSPQPTPAAPEVPQSPQPSPPMEPQSPQPVPESPQPTPALPQVSAAAPVVPQSPQPVPQSESVVPQSPQPTAAAAQVPQSPQPVPAPQAPAAKPAPTEPTPTAPQPPFVVPQTPPSSPAPSSKPEPKEAPLCPIPAKTESTAVKIPECPLPQPQKKAQASPTKTETPAAPAKKEEAEKQTPAATESGSGASPPGDLPTPPPRKGNGGGGKKAAKPKK